MPNIASPDADWLKPGRSLLSRTPWTWVWEASHRNTSWPW